MSLDALPRGPHRLSRETVTGSQRTRLLNAVIELGAERGFASLTISDIVGRAGVARRTFYELFEDKEACCIAALDYAATEIVAVLASAHPDPTAQLRVRISAYIGALLETAARPELVAMLISDAGIAGPAAAIHQRKLRARIADGVSALTDAVQDHDPEVRAASRTRSLAIVGAVNEIIQQTVSTSGPGQLPRLRDELTDIVVALQRK